MTTMAATEKIKFAWDAVKATDNLHGDIVEVGVYKGGTSMVMAYSLLHAARESKPSRSIWLFDTFEGLPPPGPQDDSRAHRKWNSMEAQKNVNTTLRLLRGQPYVDRDGKPRWNYGPLDLVQRNMRSTGFPPSMLKFVKGKVEETLTDPANVPQSISVLRLDTDFFSSTKTELSILFPRLVNGGILIVDDYCTWGGAKRAVDEFLVENGHILRNVTRRGALCFKAVKAGERPSIAVLRRPATAAS